MRRAAAVLLWVATCFAAEAAAPDGHCMAASPSGGCRTGAVTDADGSLLPGLHVFFEAPTDRYDHGILGDAIEWERLAWVQQRSDARGPSLAKAVSLPPSMVFEDVAPRLADLDGDGTPEVIVVETDLSRGARLAVWGLRDQRLVRLAATPHIGAPHRWLAPIGAADLDGDGTTEIAYIDRPHLAKILRIWRWKAGRLTEVAAASGVTNHRIGDRAISGGLRDCGQGPEMIVADADWTRIVSVRFGGTGFSSRDIGPVRGSESFDRALACR